MNCFGINLHGFRQFSDGHVPPPHLSGTEEYGRGAIEIVIASIGLSAGVISTELFSILVFIAVFTTALVPPTMKWGVEWLERADELVELDTEVGI